MAGLERVGGDTVSGVPASLQPHVAVPAERGLPLARWHLLWAVQRPVDQAGYKESLYVLRANSGLWWLEYGLWSLFFVF